MTISGLRLDFQRPEVKGLKFHHHGSYVSLGIPHLAHDLDEAYSPPRRPNGDQVWRPVRSDAKALCFFADAVAPTQSCLYGSCARETFGSAGFPIPVRQPAYSCHPFVWRRV